MKNSTITVFSAPGQPITLEKVDIPILRNGEVLIQNEYVTLCRSDLNTYTGKRREKTPTILGHEIVGRIMAFAPDHPQVDTRGSAIRVGDRVSWAIYASKPEDPLSQQGIPQKAADLFKYGHERISADSNLHGGLSEYTLLRRYTPISKLDEKIPLPVAAIINCSVATIAGAIRLAGPLRGNSVLVSGTGMLGVVAVAMSKSEGASKVIALDVRADRLLQAKAFGADEVMLVDETFTAQLSARYQDNPYDIILECSGVKSAMETTLMALGIGGTAVWVGATHPGSKVQIDAEQVIRKLWTIRGLHNYNQTDFIHAVTFMEKYHSSFPFESLIHPGFTLNQVNEAFDYAVTENPFRVGLKIRGEKEERQTES